MKPRKDMPKNNIDNRINISDKIRDINYCEKQYEGSIDLSFNTAAIEAIRNNNYLAHLATGDDNLGTIAGRGEVINNIYIIFYNRAYELFRYICWGVNDLFDKSLRVKNLYSSIFREFYDDRDRIEFIDMRIIYNQHRYAMHNNIILPSYSCNDDSSEKYDALNIASSINKLCNIEIYLNLDINDINLIGLAAVSTIYTTACDKFYNIIMKTDSLEEFSSIINDITEMFLGQIEKAINILKREAVGIYEANAKALVGPFLSYQQMHDIVANDRINKINVFIKND